MTTTDVETGPRSPDGVQAKVDGAIPETARNGSKHKSLFRSHQQSPVFPAPSSWEIWHLHLRRAHHRHPAPRRNIWDCPLSRCLGKGVSGCATMRWLLLKPGRVCVVGGITAVEKRSIFPTSPICHGHSPARQVPLGENSCRPFDYKRKKGKVTVLMESLDEVLGDKTGVTGCG